MENCLIILNYNDANSCIKLTNKILNYPSVNKIIIVDNCSSDDSYTKLIKLKNKKVDIVRTKKMVVIHMEIIMDVIGLSRIILLHI